MPSSCAALPWPAEEETNGARDFLTNVSVILTVMAIGALLESSFRISRSGRT
jgi:hypothetical protein